MSRHEELPARRPLGRTGVEVTALSIGTPQLGSDSAIDAPVSDVAREAGKALLSGPIPLLDTSNSYGDGRSERALGAALAEIGGLPEGRVVVTKADRDRATGEFGADRVLRSFEESRERLGLETFPVYHLHDPYTITFAEATAPGGAVEALVRLRDQGLVGSLGIAAGPIDLLEDYLSTEVFDVVLTHNRYTLLDRSAEELIARAHAAGVAVFNAAPFGGGLLAGHGAEAPRYAYSPATGEILAWVDRLDGVCAAWDVDRRAAALQFSLRNPAVDSTLVGTRRAERVPELLALATAAIPDGFWDDVVALGTPPLASEGVQR